MSLLRHTTIMRYFNLLTLFQLFFAYCHNGHLSRSPVSKTIDNLNIARKKLLKNELIREQIGFRTMNLDSWNAIENEDKRTELLSNNTSNKLKYSIQDFIQRYFLPSGDLSPDYYRYATWRMMQRFVASTSNVFGTQSLLLALGFKKSSIGVAAASTWILKDALGKFSRIYWASKYGRKFDADAKQWRFLSSVFFAVGNGLEILTYMIPSMFLVIAAVANALKQMAMVTYSSTRNTIYKSFSRGSDNIGDITAKGESQTAVIDLLGMFCGILATKAIGTSKSKIVAIFSVLTVLDLLCIYNEIKSVVFDSLNFERTGIALRQLFHDIDKISQSTTTHSNHLITSISGKVNQLKSYQPQPNKHFIDQLIMLTPYEVSRREKIYLSSKINEGIFHTYQSSSIPSNISQYYDSIFHDHENFMIRLQSIDIAKDGYWYEKLLTKLPLLGTSESSASVMGDLMRSDSVYISPGAVTKTSLTQSSNDKPVIQPKYNQSLKMIKVKIEIVLHNKATSIDIFRSLVIVHRITWLLKSSYALPFLYNKYVSTKKDVEKTSILDILNNHILPDLMKDAYGYEREWIDVILQKLAAVGWIVSKFTFGSIRTRELW